VELGPLWLDRNLVFDAGDGSLMAKQRVGTRFATAVRQVEVKPLTLHGCRHTMAVTWLQMGRSPASVAKRLGHKSAAFTLDVYAKVSAQWQMNDVDIVETMRKTPQKEETRLPEGTLIAWPE